MSKDQSKPKLDDRFIKSIKGKDFVVYAGLLDLAHQIGIQSIRVKTIQYPTKENGLEAICEAHVVSKSGEDFIEIADANPNNVAPLVKAHVLRMAATRAKGRALRDMTNIGITCLEELGNIDDLENEKPVNDNRTSKTQKPQTTARNTGTNDAKAKNSGNKKKTETTQTKKKEDSKKEPSNAPAPSDGPKMSAAQKKAILNLAKRRGLSEEDLTKLSLETFNVNFEYLDSSSASVFIRDLQHAA
ncbi:hypothetical protein [Desulfobacter latus]|uniref:Uncharacterized protein n=1 Tax=Desulfobacter latus TaxID=2292 RepID=A0A850T9F6_9BACT|nr:hypothetical protein [Desulfobacter latus]NWH05895.1 hypothetical protein [Desulfobacter latus]